MTQTKNRDAELATIRAAAEEFDTVIAAWGATEDELMKEYTEIRRVSRENRRDAE